MHDDDYETKLASIVDHLKKALALAKEMNDELTASVIEHALDEALLSPFKRSNGEGP